MYTNPSETFAKTLIDPPKKRYTTVTLVNRFVKGLAKTLKGFYVRFPDENLLYVNVHPRQSFEGTHRRLDPANTVYLQSYKINS